VVDTWNRVLVLDADSRLWGSDDAGTIFFPLPVGPVTSYDLSMPTLRVAVRQGSTLQVQKGTLSSSFVTVHTNVSSYQLLNYYVSVITPGGALQSTYGPDGYFLDYTFSGSAGFAQSVSVAP
jgi:hypothetical protein